MTTAPSVCRSGAFQDSLILSNSNFNVEGGSVFEEEEMSKGAKKILGSTGI